MTAEEYLNSKGVIGLENIIGEEFFNDEDKSYYTVQELMEAYHKAEMKRKIDRINNITQPSISQILNELKQ